MRVNLAVMAGVFKLYMITDSTVTGYQIAVYLYVLTVLIFIFWSFTMCGKSQGYAEDSFQYSLRTWDTYVEEHFAD